MVFVLQFIRMPEGIEKITLIDRIHYGFEAYFPFKFEFAIFLLTPIKRLI